MATPTTLPDTPDVESGPDRNLSNMFGGTMDQKTGLNKMIHDIEEAWAVLGAGITSPYGVMRKIAEVSGTGSSSVLEFSSIPATYRQLVIFLLARTTGAGAPACQLTFETSPTAGAYNYQRLVGNGATASADEAIGTSDYIFLGGIGGTDHTAQAHRCFMVVIPEYGNTNTYKSVLSCTIGGYTVASGGLSVNYIDGIWESTAAINRIRLTLAANNWTTTSRATLYGMPA